MKFSVKTKDYGDTNFITGMRAFAAFGVLLVHSGGAGLYQLGEGWGNLATLGSWGVYVFFVISGFSVASSYESSAGYFGYINKRLWRIAPIYYFWIAVAITLSVTSVPWQQRFNVSVDLYNVLMHLFFVSFLDYRITNSILGVEWSISIEVFWYFLIPALVLAGKSRLALVVSVLASFYIYKYSIEHPEFIERPQFKLLQVRSQDAALAMHWNPVPYAFAYCLGVTAYRLREYFRRSNSIGNYAILAVFSLLLVYVASPGFIKWAFLDEFIFISILTFVLILFGSSKSILLRSVFENKVILFLGAISYGVYLSHFPLIELSAKLGITFMGSATLKFFAIAIAATGVSTLTYYLIERPSLAFGRALGKQTDVRKVS
jgi:peptidoglycan/LPS O-acetylase OafA/YrhL